MKKNLGNVEASKVANDLEQYEIDQKHYQQYKEEEEFEAMTDDEWAERESEKLMEQGHSESCIERQINYGGGCICN